VVARKKQGEQKNENITGKSDVHLRVFSLVASIIHLEERKGLTDVFMLLYLPFALHLLAKVLAANFTFKSIVILIANF
jgi:hypothetical protein